MKEYNKILRFQKKCWWCGSPATTREHKYKKSQLKRNFSSTFDCREMLSWFSGKKTRGVQGLNSKRLKFSALLCKNCNNQRSQPFDRAYDDFMSHVDNNSSEIIKKESIDLEDIYHDRVKQQFASLLGYLVKHISCRLAESDYGIPGNFINFLNGKDVLRHLTFKFGINCAVVEAQEKLESDNIDDGMFFWGDLLIFKKQNRFQSHISHNWLFITYYYDKKVPGTALDLVGNVLRVFKYNPLENESRTTSV